MLASGVPKLVHRTFYPRGSAGTVYQFGDGGFMGLWWGGWKVGIGIEAGFGARNAPGWLGNVEIAASETRFLCEKACPGYTPPVAPLLRTLVVCSFFQMNGTEWSAVFPVNHFHSVLNGMIAQPRLQTLPLHPHRNRRQAAPPGW